MQSVKRLSEQKLFPGKVDILPQDYSIKSCPEFPTYWPALQSPFPSLLLLLLHVPPPPPPVSGWRWEVNSVYLEKPK